MDTKARIIEWRNVGQIELDLVKGGSLSVFPLIDVHTKDSSVVNNKQFQQNFMFCECKLGAGGFVSAAVQKNQYS